MADEDEIDEEESPFIAWLRQDQGGGTLRDLDNAMAEVLDGLRHPRAKGKAAVMLRVTMAQHGPTVTTLSEVASKVPREPRVADVFYPGADGRLHTEDPNRPKLDFSNVVQMERDTGEVVKVNSDTGEVQRVEGSK